MNQITKDFEKDILYPEMEILGSVEGWLAIKGAKWMADRIINDKFNQVGILSDAFIARVRTMAEELGK